MLSGTKRTLSDSGSDGSTEDLETERDQVKSAVEPPEMQPGIELQGEVAGRPRHGIEYTRGTDHVDLICVSIRA